MFGNMMRRRMLALSAQKQKPSKQKRPKTKQANTTRGNTSSNNMNHLISEAYKIKEIQSEFARKLKVIMSELGAGRAMQGDIGLWHYRKGNHFIVVSNHKEGQKRNHVSMRNERYDTATSSIEYGKTNVITNDTVEIDGYSKTLDNSKGSKVKSYNVSENVELTTSTAYTFSQGYEFSVTSETEISGSYGGAEISQKLQATFGSSFGMENSESESQTITRSVSIDFDVEPGDKEVVIFSKERLITETPFKLKGYLDFDFTVDFEDWARNPFFMGHRHGRKEYSFDGFLDFERFLRGYHIDYPNMANWRPSAAAERAMAWIFNKDNRYVDVEGIKRKEIEDNASVETLSG